jgi:apolipoprotein N-acyltransferase
MKPRLVDLKRGLLAVAGGLLLTASFPRLDMAWTAWIALVPLMFAVRGLSAREGFRMGILAGLAHYMTLVYWLVITMNTYGGLPKSLCAPILFLFSAYLAIYPALFAAFFTRVVSRPVVCLLVTPAAWTAQEYLRAFVLSGFPWELLGYSQYRQLKLIQVADITGVYGISAVIVLANVVVFLLLAALPGLKTSETGGFRKLRLAAVGLLVLVLGLVLGYGQWRLPRIDRAASAAPAKTISLLQGNIEQGIKWDPANQEATLKKYFHLSKIVLARKPDLIVWPETAAPFYFGNDLRLTRMLQQSAAGIGVYQLIGCPVVQKRGEQFLFYNSACLLNPDGSLAGRYDKAHLVPFGEYVPFKKWLPFLGKIVEQVGDFQRGRRGATIQWENQRLGVLICYELIFADLSRAAVRNGAGLLVNITNDAWYGRSSAPYQHFSMAVLRAVETRRALVRAANTGISGVVGPGGRILAQTPVFEDATVTRRVPLLSQKSLYVRVGDAFAAACLAVSVVTFLWTALFGRRSRKTKQPG